MSLVSNVDIICVLLDVLVCSIAVYVYELFCWARRYVDEYSLCEHTDSPRSRSYERPKYDYDFAFIFNILAYIVEKVAFVHFSLFRSVLTRI